MIAIQTLAILVLALAKERLELRLRHAADTDFLTGLFNRRAFFAQGGQQAEACRLARHPYSVVIFDLDDFKQVNDGYGHPAGDAVLRAFALAARECLSRKMWPVVWGARSSPSCCRGSMAGRRSPRRAACLTVSRTMPARPPRTTSVARLPAALRPPGSGRPRWRCC